MNGQGCTRPWFYQSWAEGKSGDPSSVHKKPTLPPSASFFWRKHHSVGEKILNHPQNLLLRVMCFHPPPVTRQVVQRTGAMPLSMDQPKVRGNRGQQCRFRAAAVQQPLQQDIRPASAAAMLSNAHLFTGQQGAALLVPHN